MSSTLFAWNPHSVPCFLATAVLVTCGLLIHRWERGSRISRHFLTFSLLFATWTLARGLLRLLADPETALLVCRYFFAAIALGLAPLLGFILLVLRARQSHRRLNRANWVFSILMAMLALGSPWVVADVRQLPWGFEPVHGPLGLVLCGWILGLIGVTARAGWVAWRRHPGGAERRRLQLFGIALAGLYAASLDMLVGAGIDLYPFGVLGVVMFTLVSAYITARLGLVEVTPQLAAAEIAAMVRGALLVLDGEGVVQFVNEQATRMLGSTQPPLPGTPLTRLLGEAVAPANLAALAALPDAAEHEVLLPQPEAPARLLALTVSALRDGHGRIAAFVCVLRAPADARGDPQQHARLEADLRRAIAERELIAHYQPIIDVASGRIAGFEALVRWQHPRHGLLGPAQFLDLAAAVGLLAAVDDRVLERVCAELPTLRALAPAGALFVSVNQSADALGRAWMPQRVSELLQRHGLPATALRFELLESTVLTPAVRSTLARLEALGIGICIDDFGTGYSSLSRLHEVPVNTIKIDRSFVRAMSLGESGDRLVRAMVTFAASLGLEVVAEGVTHAAQAETLRALGCTRLQGYLYSPPVPLERACALLAPPPPPDAVAACPA